MDLILVLLTIIYFINAVITICCTNLIFCVFSLVFTFFFGILLFLFLSAEYITVIFLIVYLGAIVVTSSSVTMSLDVKILDTSLSDFNLFIGLCCFIVFSVFFVCFAFTVYDLFNFILLKDIYFSFDFDFYTSLTDAEKIGYCLFNEFGILLIVGGVIMMLVIIGCFLIIYKNK